MGAVPVFVSTDNALGSPRGDVDDGFALAALCASGARLAGIASVFGNTSEPRAHENIRSLAALFGLAVPVHRGARRRGDGPTEAALALAAAPAPLRVLALGPLTDLAGALAHDPACAERWSEVVVVGGSAVSRGRWPPLWPHEFNVTHDVPAARALFASGAPLTIVPLDAARRLRAGAAELETIGGPAARALREGSRRWLRRARLLRWSRTFAVYDLAAALYLLAPERFEVESRPARLHRSGWLELGAGERVVRVVRRFDPRTLWSDFLALQRGEARTRGG